MRKQLDPRIPTLINNGVKKNHRSFIVLVGDKGRDQVGLLFPYQNFFRLSNVVFVLGREPPLSALASPCVCTAVRTMVFQEGTRFQQVGRSISVPSNLVQLIQDFLLYGSHRKQREAKIKREVKRGIREPNEQDPFEIFVTVTDIRYTYANPEAYSLYRRRSFVQVL
jgi:N-acetyltransferase 10